MTCAAFRRVVVSTEIRYAHVYYCDQCHLNTAHRESSGFHFCLRRRKEPMHAVVDVDFMKSRPSRSIPHVLLLLSYFWSTTF